MRGDPLRGLVGSEISGIQAERWRRQGAVDKGAGISKPSVLRKRLELAEFCSTRIRDAPLDFGFFTAELDEDHLSTLRVNG